MEHKVVYCITNEKGLFYQKKKVPSYMKSKVKDTCDFLGLFDLYARRGNAQKIANHLNCKYQTEEWVVKEINISI